MRIIFLMLMTLGLTGCYESEIDFTANNKIIYKINSTAQDIADNICFKEISALPSSTVINTTKSYLIEIKITDIAKLKQCGQIIKNHGNGLYSLNAPRIEEGESFEALSTTNIINHSRLIDIYVVLNRNTLYKTSLNQKMESTSKYSIDYLFIDFKKNKVADIRKNIEHYKKIQIINDLYKESLVDKSLSPTTKKDKKKNAL